jgi:DNA topoisomerase-6 subunit B
LRQSRGIQGIGISAAVLYSQLTTGKAVKVWSKTSKDKKMHFYEMHIDVHKNQAEVKKEESLDNNKPHGVKIEIEIEARYQKGKQGVDEYLRQTSITNPHLQLTYINPDNEKNVFKRASNNLPKEPKEIKPHPHGTELGVLIRMLKETKSKNLQSFLTTEFCRIGSGTAKEMIVKALLNPNDKPQNLMHDQSERLYKSMQEAKVIAPPTDCLSPIGENDFLKSVQSEIKAEFYTSVTRSPTVYRGYPFQIDCALAYGGELSPDETLRVMRFANRVPLLYQQSACSTTEAIKETNWRAYGLQQSSGNLPVGPVVLAVHIASVWVPFTSEAKEAIAHYPEIIKFSIY